MGIRRLRWRMTPSRARRDGTAAEPGGGPPQDRNLDPVARLLRPLGPEGRALVILHYCHQIRSAEIAEEFGLRYAKVPSRVNRAMQVLRRHAHAAGVSPSANDVEIVDALKQALMGATVSLSPVDVILHAADRRGRVSILPLPPPGLVFRSSPSSEKTLPRYLPYLVAVTVTALLIGVVVAGLNLYAGPQDGPTAARSIATPAARTHHRGGGSPTAPPTVAPTPLLPPPAPASTAPPATPAPAVPAAAPPPAAPPAAVLPRPAPAPPRAPAPPPPPARGHGHGPGPGDQGDQGDRG